MSDPHRNKSKFLSLVLRHEPQAAGVALDDAGWVAVSDLLAGCGHAGMAITEEELREIVRTSEKQRFALSDDGARIRANQGHSVDVELGYEPCGPPAVLWHGTASRHLASIREQGLLKGDRQHVHLSATVETASAVGRRHGTLALLRVDAAGMHRDGHRFVQTPNGVWLTDHVPVRYLTDSAEALDG